MPLFYFNDHAADGALRLQGREYPDLNAALAEANRTARSLLAKRLRERPSDLRGRVDIEDDRRRTVARVLFADLAHQIT